MTPPMPKVRPSLGMKHQPRRAARGSKPFPEQHPGFGFGVASRDITAPLSRSNRTPSLYPTFLARPFGCHVPASRQLIEQLRRVSDDSFVREIKFKLAVAAVIQVRQPSSGQADSARMRLLPEQYRWRSRGQTSSEYDLARSGTGQSRANDSDKLIS